MNIWTKESALNYLYANSVRAEATGCLEWQGSRTRDGYGQISTDTLHRQFGIKGVHRLMVHLVEDFEFTHRGQLVMHSCDNRCCIEPSHLRVGTPLENMQDCVAKGRARKPFGEGHARAKMTDDRVRVVRQLIAHGLAQNMIAKLFEISNATISSIHRRNTWKHVD